MEFLLSDVLLNFLLILTPLYFFQFIISNYTSIGTRVFLGGLLGVAAIVCMLFPMVSGDGFLWDLRWIALLISILYGGFLSGSITATLIIVFRFSLGGFQGAVIVVIVAVVLLLVFLYLRRLFQKMTFRQRLIVSIAFGVITWGVSIAGIVAHFYLNEALYDLQEMAGPVFSSMLALYVISSMTFVYFSESMRFYTTLKNEALAKEKVNYITEVGEVLGLQLSEHIDRATDVLEQLKNQPVENRSERIALIEQELMALSGALQKYTSSQDELLNDELRPLNTVVEEVVETLRPYASQKGVRMTTDVDLSEEPMVRFGSMKQILEQLVKNALDATPRNGQVTISAIVKRNWLYIYVDDSGIGIAAEQLAGLVDVSLNSPNSIAGEGLRMTQRIVRELEGTFSITSEIQKGTTVTLKFPL